MPRTPGTPKPKDGYETLWSLLKAARERSDGYIDSAEGIRISLDRKTASARAARIRAKISAAN